MNHTDILIIGAGPTGLTAATLLARYGIDFRIIDKGDGPTEQSRALGVQARTLELWHKLGLAERALRDGQQVSALHLITKRALAQHKMGQPLLVFGRDGRAITPYPFLLVFEQNGTERLLVDDLHAQGHAVAWQTEITSLAQQTDAVQVALRNASGREESLCARYIIGADGAHSFVRRTLDLGFEGATYEQALFLADVEMQWALPRDKFFAEMTRHGLLAFFPMRGSGYSETRYRVIGSLTPEMPTDSPITQEDVQCVLDRDSAADAQITQLRWASVYRVHKRMTEHFRVGRIFLAGDAAHIHSPAGGQGMNTGIQDAWNLAWKLALVLRGEAHEALLDSYEPERMPVARAILKGSDRGFFFIASANPLVGLLRRALLPCLTRITSRPMVGTRIFRFISQTWIAYRDSAIVDGERSTKAAQPGDRAPHARFDGGSHAGESIFTLLRGVDHHLLLFAGAGVDASAARTNAEALLSEYAIPTHVHVIDAAQRALYAAYGVQLPTVFLVRPDGHLAWRGPVDDLGGLMGYLDRWYTRGESILPVQSGMQSAACVGQIQAAL